MNSENQFVLTKDAFPFCLSWLKMSCYVAKYWAENIFCAVLKPKENT